MDNVILQSLLKQYEQKRFLHEKERDMRKFEIYKLLPDIQKIDIELANTSILTAKSILSSNKNQIKLLKIQIEKLKKEKEQILKNAGKSLDDLSIHYDCEKCKDTGYILTSTGSTMCPCLKQKLFDLEFNKSNSLAFRNQTFDNFNLNLFSDKIDKEKYSSNLSPRKNVENIEKSAINFVDNFDDINQKNLLFSGGTGLGKTFLSNCIVNELLKRGKTVLYQTSPVMLDTIIAENFSNIKTTLPQDLLTVDLLVIDDLGTETMNSLKFTELYKIINTRLLNQNGKITKTIISTNLDLQSLFNTYDERLVSRFFGNYNIYRFFGDDIRLIKK